MEQPPEQYPDGLIVTGREPLTSDLRDEAYWPSIKRILARRRSTRVRQYGRVWRPMRVCWRRRRRAHVRGRHKHFGIFGCEQARAARAARRAPQSRVPHSRWYGVSPGQLAAKGYQVLTRTSDGGADTFVKQDAGLFVFFQGHPEYEPETLMGEYRRDVGRYLKGEAETYPLLPLDYFDEETENVSAGH